MKYLKKPSKCFIQLIYLKLVGIEPSEDPGLPAWYLGKPIDLESEMAGSGSVTSWLHNLGNWNLIFSSVN